MATKPKKTATTGEKIGALAARVLDDGVATPDEVKRLAGSVLRQREQRGKKPPKIAPKN